MRLVVEVGGCPAKLREQPDRRLLDQGVLPETLWPYDVYWKIRNYGEEAERADSLRGDIHRDDGSRMWTERTSYIGHHYVEAMIVRNGVCVAKSRQDVIVI